MEPGNATCAKPMKTTSNGLWQGDNPLDFTFPLLLLQICIVIVVTRALAFLLRPLRQPRVIAEIIGGVLLGPSLVGRSKQYMKTVFPSNATPVLESAANIGLLFFLFLVGLELDIEAIRRSGRKTLLIAAGGISVPFIIGIGIAYVLRLTISKNVGFTQFLLFMGVSISVTALPVLARILAELKLLTTDVGQTAIASAAVNDVVAWVLLALAIALSGTGKSPFISVYILLCGVAFVLFMLFVIKPLMNWMVKHSPEGEPVKELYICITLAGVLLSGFMTDLIGIHAIFGAFMFGIAVPKKGPFAGMLIEKIEDFVSCLMLPLFFASSGLKTNVAAIHGATSWGLLFLVIAGACAGKILGTFVVAVAQGMPVRESMTLGFLMNTKGLVELIVLNIGKDRKVLNDECFAILVLMALLTTVITTPAVMLIYKPARRAVPYKHRKVQRDKPNDELRILACIHGTRNIPSISNLIEACRGTTKSKSPLRLYIMHLVELSERSSAIMMVHKASKNGLPFCNPNRAQQDQIVIAFEAYGHLSRVAVRPMTAISDLHSMHEDVCNIAEQKRAAMIILPFHKYQRVDGILETMDLDMRAVNQKVLEHAPCSVAILVDRGFAGQSQISPSTMDHHIAVLFFGGPDDREALVFACRMAEHPGIRLTVVRFVPSQDSHHLSLNIAPLPENEREAANEGSYKFATAELNRELQDTLDRELIEKIIKSATKKSSKSVPHSPVHYPLPLAKFIKYEEKETDNMVETVPEIARGNRYNLLVVGRGRFPTTLVAHVVDRPGDCGELGPIGDLLASPNLKTQASVLVVQQHDTLLSNEEAPFSKVVVETRDCVTPTSSRPFTSSFSGSPNFTS